MAKKHLEIYNRISYKKILSVECVECSIEDYENSDTIDISGIDIYGNKFSYDIKNSTDDIVIMLEFRKEEADES